MSDPTAAEIRTLLASNGNLAAFLRLIREGESNQVDDGPESAYTLVNGGAHFSDFTKHPYAGMRAPPGRAAGAVQFIPSTWADMQRKYALPDFSPASQDVAAVGCIIKRGALDNVLAGNIPEAIGQCRLEWTSLPGAAENSGRYTMDKALAVYRKWGGRIATQPAAPIVEAPAAPTPAPQPTTTGGSQMGVLALLQIFGPILAGLIPQIASIVKPGSEVAQRNVALAQTVVDTVVKAAGTATEGTPATMATLGAAIEKMQDPKDGKALTAAVTQAVVTQADVLAVLEIGQGGIAAARATGIQIQTAERPFWYNPVVWISAAFFPMMYVIVLAVLFTVYTEAPDAASLAAMPWWARVGFDQATRSGLVNLIVGMVFGGVVGVWFGTSYGSQRKTELAATATAADQAKL